MSERWIIKRHSLVDGAKMYYTGESGGLSLFTFEQTRARRFDCRPDAAVIAARQWTVVRLVRKVAP